MPMGAAVTRSVPAPPPVPAPPNVMRPTKSFAHAGAEVVAANRMRRSKSMAREPNRRGRRADERSVASTARSSVSSTAGGGGKAGGAGNPSAKVEEELSRVRKGWEAAEHRAIDLKVELLQTQVEARTLRASLQAVEIEGQMAQHDADELRRRMEELRATVKEAQAAAVVAREAQSAAEARRDEINMTHLVMKAERDRAVGDAQHARKEAEAVRSETEGLLGKLQLQGVQRAETHAKALAKWEGELSRFLEAGANSRLELVLAEGNARVFHELRGILDKQRAVSEAEVAELKAWALRADDRLRANMQERQAQLHRQLVEVGTLREGLLGEVRNAAKKEAETKLGEARTEVAMMQRLLAEAASKAEKREEAVASQMAEHQAALAWATGELAHEAESLREGAARLVYAETVAVEALQRQEQLREKTAKKVLLQLYRGLLAACFRAWRTEVTRTVGRSLAQAGSQVGMAALRRRSMAATSGGGAGGDDGEGDEGGGRGGGGGDATGVSEYLQSTLMSMEEDWASREEQEALVRQQRELELQRVKDEMRRMQAQHAEARQALTEQAQLLATEAERAQREKAKAEAETRAALAALEEAQAGALEVSGGASAENIRLRMRLGEAEERSLELEAEVEAARAAHAAALQEWRAELRGSELRRLAQHEAMLSQQRDQRERLGAASDATHQLLQQARAENERLQERLDKSEETRRSEGAANARWVLELQSQLLRVASQRKGSAPAADKIRAYGGI